MTQPASAPLPGSFRRRQPPDSGAAPSSPKRGSRQWRLKGLASKGCPGLSSGRARREPGVRPAAHSPRRAAAAAGAAPTAGAAGPAWRRGPLSAERSAAPGRALHATSEGKASTAPARPPARPSVPNSQGGLGSLPRLPARLLRGRLSARQPAPPGGPQRPNRALRHGCVVEQRRGRGSGAVVGDGPSQPPGVGSLLTRTGSACLGSVTAQPATARGAAQRRSRGSD